MRRFDKLSAARFDASTGLSASKVSDRARVVVAAPAVERLGQAEVEDLHLAVVSDLDVGGLEVAMDDAAFVRLSTRGGADSLRPAQIGRSKLRG